MKHVNNSNGLMTSWALVSALMHFEGLRLEAYKCPGGVWTIGYGHTFNVKRGDRISKYAAKEMLIEDIRIVERQVMALKVCHKQGELDALVSFAFNLGIERLKESTLLKRIQRHEGEDAIKHEFRRWVRAGGKELPGLVSRREWECLRFFQDSPYLPMYKKKH